MSQRPQRAAAVQAIKANAAALAPRRRSDSQASNKTITSPHIKSEERRYQGRSSPSMDVMMQRSSHHDLRRLDSIGSASLSAPRQDATSSYNPNVFPMYWSTQEDPSAMGPAPPQPTSTTTYHQPQFWPESAHERHGLDYHDHVTNHAAFDPNYAYAGQASMLGLKQDSALSVGLDGSLDLGENMHRDHKPFDGSDGMALLDSLPFKASSSADNDDSYEDSTDSDLPPEKKKLSAAFRPRGRKKRNKCTPDQLRSLEAFFEKNRNPTGRVRLELSRKLRMPERSVQVWFQNRRAKVKTIERRGDTGSDSGRKKSCSIRLNDKDAYGAAAIGSRGPRDAQDQAPSVTAIPTSALCIGSWRRVSPLICFFSRRLQSLTWYLTSESIGFKLEIPWTSIRSAYFDGPSNPSIAERAEGVRVPLGHFVIDLERPPTFFMEVFRSAPIKNGSNEEPKVSWRQCEDFTEDHQAMNVSRHVLNGPYEELRSAVQALARCNDVLQRLIVFRDAEQRAAGAIPTGSDSTADNFGLVNGAGVRSTDPFTPIFDAPTAFAGTDAYSNTMQMPLQPTAMSSTSSVPKSAAWHGFRAPVRPGGEHNWEFDSPASVSTNLSEASLDSNQRHQLGYSSYGVSSSIEASPRSGLGSSMDLNSLRIDTGGMPSFGPSNLPMMGEGGFDGPRASFEGWEGHLGYEVAPPPAEAQYSLSSTGVLEGGHASTQAMQPPGLDANFGMCGQVQSFDRNGGDRQDYSSNSAEAHANGHQQSGGSMTELPHTQESHATMYEGNSISYTHNTGSSSSLLLSRRFSHTEGATRVEYAQDVKHDACGASVQKATEDHRQSSAAHLAPSAVTGRIASFDEDAFCAKTPTHRTSFSNDAQMAQSVHDGASQRWDANGDERHTGSTLNPVLKVHDQDDATAAHGRSRSNTYRPSTHAARAATLSAPSMQRANSDHEPQTSFGAKDGTADRDSSSQDGHATTASGSDSIHKSSTDLVSPDLLSLSSQDISNQRELSPSLIEPRSKGDLGET